MYTLLRLDFRTLGTIYPKLTSIQLIIRPTLKYYVKYYVIVIHYSTIHVQVIKNNFSILYLNIENVSAT